MTMRQFGGCSTARIPDESILYLNRRRLMFKGSCDRMLRERLFADVKSGLDSSGESQATGASRQA